MIKKLTSKLNLGKIFVCFFMIFVMGITASANEPGEIILDYIEVLFRLVGGIMALFGAYKLGMSFASDKPEDKVRGVQTLVAGIAVMVAANNAPANLRGAATAVPAGPWTIDAAIDMLAGWITGVAMVIGFYGFIKFAMSLQNDEMGEKVKSLGLMIGGVLLVMAVTAAQALHTSHGGAINFNWGAAIGQFTDLDPTWLIQAFFNIVGAVAVCFGGYKFATSFRQDDAAARAQGIAAIIAGVILIVIAAFVDAAFIWG